MHSIGGVQSVKKHVQQGTDKRAAGELEGARPASNTINRRPKVLIHQRLLEQSSILIISKCSADEACQKKSSQDFFDKLNNLRITDPEIVFRRSPHIRELRILFAGSLHA